MRGPFSKLSYTSSSLPYRSSPIYKLNEYLFLEQMKKKKRGKKKKEKKEEKKRGKRINPTHSACFKTKGKRKEKEKRAYGMIRYGMVKFWVLTLTYTPQVINIAGPIIMSPSAKARGVRGFSSSLHRFFLFPKNNDSCLLNPFNAPVTVWLCCCCCWFICGTVFALAGNGGSGGNGRFLKSSFLTLWLVLGLGNSASLQEAEECSESFRSRRSSSCWTHADTRFSLPEEVFGRGWIGGAETWIRDGLRLRPIGTWTAGGVEEWKDLAWPISSGSMMAGGCNGGSGGDGVRGLIKVVVVDREGGNGGGVAGGVRRVLFRTSPRLFFRAMAVLENA